jgi:O-antigen ligase
VTEAKQQATRRRLELAVAAQVAIFVVGVSWAFGGNADWVRTPISIWGSVGIALTVAVIVRPETRNRMAEGTISWLWPIVILNALVGVSCLTPGFMQLKAGTGTYLLPVRVAFWIPSAARAELALRSLWQFDGIYFSCINLALAVSHRRVLRVLLAVAVGNALVLAIFGIVQKLAESKGIFFGAVKSPQEFFFASFVYDNHWGSFCILMLGACIGLIIRYSHGIRGSGFLRGPALTGFAAALVVGSSIPLSGSRACSILLVMLIALGVVHGTPRIHQALRFSGASPLAALGALVFAAILMLGGVWMVAGDSIQARAAKTREQVAAILAQGSMGSRSTLYRDTLRMASDRILFGWGMGSYPTVFPLYNSQVSKVDVIPIIYHDAHSDWLQSVAEIGLAGTSLVAAAALIPALAIRRTRMRPIPYFLFVGAALILAYALIEFPFGNVAVVLSWWFCFFGAIQYVRLTDGQEC